MVATGAYIKIEYFTRICTIEYLQYQDVVDRPLITQANKANDILFSKYFKGLIDYENVQCTETRMLTKPIVRELLLNAITHKDYASDVPIQVSVYEDKIVIFNMDEWLKRVPTDSDLYQKHESVPHNPKIANV